MSGTVGLSALLQVAVVHLDVLNLAFGRVWARKSPIRLMQLKPANGETS